MRISLSRTCKEVDIITRKYAVIDTSIFLLIYEGYSILDGLKEDIDEKYDCVTTDSVIRELLRTSGSGRELILEYLEKIFRECIILYVSEDLEREEADHDLIRVSLRLKASLITLDRELKREARKAGIDIIAYKGSEKRIKIP